MERRIIQGWRARREAEHDEARRDFFEAPAEYVVTGRTKVVPVWQHTERVWAMEKKAIYRPVFGPEREVARQRLKELRRARERERRREVGYWKPKTPEQWEKRRADARRLYAGMSEERRQRILANARERYAQMSPERRRLRGGYNKATQLRYRERADVRERRRLYMVDYNASNRERLAQMKRDARASETPEQREYRLEVGRIYAQLLQLSGLRKKT